MSFDFLFTCFAAALPAGITLGEEQIMYIAVGAVLAFAAIGLLWAVLSVFKKVFGGGRSSSDDEPVASVVSAVPNAVSAAPQSDAQLIAVLTAAVAAYMAEENGTAPDPNTFRVVSFKRVSQGRAWNSK